MSGLLARNTQTQRRPKPHLYAAYKKNRKIKLTSELKTHRD